MKAESISYKDFKAGRFDRRYESQDHPILIFLRKNQRAYNIPAIMKAVKISSSAARSMLRKLKKQGKILHKSPFFAYKR